MLATIDWRRAVSLAVILVSGLTAVGSAHPPGTAVIAGFEDSVEPVQLGWPEFEEVDEAATKAAPRTVARDRAEYPVRPKHDAPRDEAPARPSNMGALARVVVRRLPDEHDFDGSLVQSGMAEPWIVPSGVETEQVSAEYDPSGHLVVAPAPVPEGETAIMAQPDVTDYQPYTTCPPEEVWTQQWMPDGLMFKSFLAGEKEPRFASVWLHDPDRGMVWETALGARLGIWRYGETTAINPNGWQLDLEGGALPRLDPEEETDVDAIDFVIGILMTRRIGPTAIEFGYGHLSSHLGDEFMIKNPTVRRINYVRDALLFGIARDVTPDVRVYAEIGYAPGAEDGAKPLESQVGAEYSPAKPYYAPFAAVNFHYREEFNFKWSTNIMAGLQIRSPTTNRLFRVGVQHYNGKAMQYEFLDTYETLTGVGMWVDF